MPASRPCSCRSGSGSAATSELRSGGALGVDGCADNAHFVAGGDPLKAAALERAHLYHLLHVAIEQADVDEFGVGAGDVKMAGAVHVDAGGRGGGQRAMAKGDKFRAARIARRS